jgi:hypothetical protein
MTEYEIYSKRNELTRESSSLDQTTKKLKQAIKDIQDGDFKTCLNDQESLDLIIEIEEKIISISEKRKSVLVDIIKLNQQLYLLDIEKMLDTKL